MAANNRKREYIYSSFVVYVLYVFILCVDVCECRHAYAEEHVWRSEEKFQESVLETTLCYHICKASTVPG